MATLKRRSGWTSFWSERLVIMRRVNGFPAVISDSYEVTNLLEGATISGFDACGENGSNEELQLLEAGRFNSNFAWAVLTAVEIEEEGLFRNIVAYL